MELPKDVGRFRRELEKIGVRIEGVWCLKWKCAAGDLNLGYVMRDGEVWTNLARHRNDPEIEAGFERYKQRLARSWGGEVKAGKQTRYVVKDDNCRFFFHSLGNERLQEWTAAIKEFQRAVLASL